eukprot:760877-Hanusia_phi.AAC.2
MQMFEIWYLANLQTVLMVGQREKRTSRQSWSYMSEVIGQATLGGRHIRMGAGEILKVMDLCAASAAMKHVQHQRTPVCLLLAWLPLSLSSDLGV